MNGYFHGISTEEPITGTRPISDIATNTIGMVCTASDADPDTFPLNKPVLLTSIKSKIDKAGDKGTLARSLDAVLDQTETPAIIVRVEEGETEAETTSNIIGKYEAGTYTGMKAFLNAQAKCKASPKILGIPVFDTQAVQTELISVAQSLNAFAYGSTGDLAEVEDVAAHRQFFGQREFMLIDDHFLSWDTATNAAERAPTIAIALGLRSKIDQQVGWHKSLSNFEVNGVTGIERGRSWGLTDKNTDVAFLNANDVTSLINDQGFYFWGNRTTSAEPLFCFEPYTRTAQIIKEMVARAHKWALAKPMSVGLFVDIAEGISSKLATMTHQGRLLGGSVWVEAQDNSKEVVKSGKFTIRYKYTPVPPLEHLGFIQEITDEYIVDLVNATIAFVGSSGSK